MPKNIKINLADCLGTSNKCGKADEQRIWNFQRRLEALEAKPDNDNQLLSITDNKLSITNGNEVTLPTPDLSGLATKEELRGSMEVIDASIVAQGQNIQFLSNSVEELAKKPDNDKQTLSIEGNELSIQNGNTITLPVYDDTKLTEKVNELEARPVGSDQTLSLDGNDLSISNGNTVTLPVTGVKSVKVGKRVNKSIEFIEGDDKSTEFFLSISGENGKETLVRLPSLVELLSQDFDYGEFYIDEYGKLGFHNGNPTYSTVNSLNSLVNLTKLKREGNKLILQLENLDWDVNNKAVLSEVDLPVFDDTQILGYIRSHSDELAEIEKGLNVTINQVNRLEGSVTTLDNSTKNNAKEIEALKNKTDVFVSDMSFSREGDEVTLKYTRTDGVEKSVSFTDKNTTMVAYDDEPLKARVTALENKPDKDEQTLKLEGEVLSISNGNSVTIPQIVQWYPHIAWAEDINPIKNFTTKTSVSAPQSQGFYANYVGFCYTTSKEDPQVPQQYRWTRVSQVTELEKQLKELKEKGVSSAPQTLNLEGTTLSISEGNSVELPVSDTKELEKTVNNLNTIVNNLKPLGNNISGEMSTHSGQSVYFDRIGNFVNLTFDSYAVRNVWEIPEGFRPKFTQTAPLWHKETGEYVGKFTIEPSGESTYNLEDKFKGLNYTSSVDPKDGTNIWENIHTLVMSYQIGG